MADADLDDDYPWEVTQEPDGTWSVNLNPWTDEKITGIRSREEAQRAYDAIYRAMQEYASNAMMD